MLVIEVKFCLVYLALFELLGYKHPCQYDSRPATTEDPAGCYSEEAIGGHLPTKCPSTLTYAD